MAIVKEPRLKPMCAKPEWGGDPNGGHRVCGGWWCTCPCHDTWDIGQGEGSEIGQHAEHEWRQVENCVYCTCSVGVRLYQGEVCTDPDERRALGAYFDAIHKKIEKDWLAMREAVLAARTDHIGPSS